MKRKFNDFKSLNKNRNDDLINLDDLLKTVNEIYYLGYISHMVDKFNIDVPVIDRMFLDQCSLIKSFLDLNFRKEVDKYDKED